MMKGLGRRSTSQGVGPSKFRVLRFRSIFDNSTAMVGFFMTLFISVVCLVSFVWTPYDPTQMNLISRFTSPSLSHWMGTDEYGRDILSRVMTGSQISIAVAVSAVIGALVVGTFLGVITGFLGGKIDLLVTRMIDVMLAIPALVFALGIVAILGPSAKSVSLALGITYSRQFARITRSSVVAIKDKAYIEASIGLGHRLKTIIYKDILPNIFPILVVQVTTALAWGILDEASLGFLGLGVQPPDSSWGSLLIEGRQYVYQGWWIAFFGGLPVTIAVFGVNMFGDGLRDIVDPRSDRRFFKRDSSSLTALSSNSTISKGAEFLLEVENLTVDFKSDSGTVRALDDVTFEIAKGEIVGIVGESASGKSTLALSILRMLPPAGDVITGRIDFAGNDMLSLDQEELRSIRGKDLTYINQDALGAMNPVTKIGEQVSEIIKDHESHSSGYRKKKSLELLRHVRLKEPEKNLRNYPHELSGGMQQRVIIAESLVLNPKLLIADEPTTALDVSIQAGILELLKTIRLEFHTSIMFITHDLATVADLCDRIIVMYAGSIVETGTVVNVFQHPQHPYTRALIGGLLPLRGKAPSVLNILEGQPPKSGEWPSGCPFHPRCPLFVQLGKPEICRKSQPRKKFSDESWVSCHFASEESFDEAL
jgi:peptide/nickel transport system permease protein